MVLTIFLGVPSRTPRLELVTKYVRLVIKNKQRVE